ncbi:hypothetical protein BSKO_02910 [Bryopsis sp. KO-2023]|nr:hypothetical protein BSKO_02910 [Bryopsis sp. KO-2023]
MSSKRLLFLTATLFFGLIVDVAFCKYDFIVVGAGASGCIVAPGLAGTGKKVLLLEAGIPTAWKFGGREQADFFARHKGQKNFTVFDMPGMTAKLRKLKSYWWENIPWALQGKGIGGSGMMNGGLTMMPPPSDFDSWPNGWQFESMEYFFKETFKKLRLTTTPSADGIFYTQGAGEAFDKLAKNQLGLEKVPLNMTSEGRMGTSSMLDVSAMGGERMDACLAYLAPGLEEHKNLELRTGAEVKFIRMNGNSEASHVVLTSGEEILLNWKGSVVLTAGPLNTPKLLLRSGIGPVSHLESLRKEGLMLNGQQFWVENGAVGRYMHDHTYSLMNFKVPNGGNFSFRYNIDKYDESALAKYFQDRTGPYAQYGAVRLAYLARPNNPQPEVELLVMPSGQEGSGDERDCDSCYRILLMLMNPKARDHFKLKIKGEECDCGNASCKIGDVCKPNLYLAEKQDRETMTWALKKVAEAANAEGYKMLMPSGADDASIQEYLDKMPVAKLGASHFAGTCAIGACVSEQLNVYGTGNVYVADSSIIPEPLHGHNVGLVFAIGLKAVEDIKNARHDAEKSDFHGAPKRYVPVSDVETTSERVWRKSSSFPVWPVVLVVGVVVMFAYRLFPFNLLSKSGKKPLLGFKKVPKGPPV